MPKAILFMLIGIVLNLAGCVSMQPQPIVVPFDEGLLKPYAGAGSSTIIGQVFLKTRGAEVRVGAGNEVELVPLIPYTQERLQRATINGEDIAPRDPRLAQYIRKTIADVQGNFEFTGIPAGEYIIYCLIQWEYGTQYGTATTGGDAFAIIKVSPNERVKVVVTR